MRVAVILPKGHELGAEKHEVTFAYKLGRIEDGVHNAPVGHEPVELDEYLTGLVAQAQEEYPDSRVEIQRLVQKGDEDAEWIPADEFDPEKHLPVGAGRTVARSPQADLRGQG